MNKKFILDHITVLLASGISRLLLFTSTAFVARMLGKHNFGIFAIFYLSLTISSIIPRSLDTTYIRFARSEKCSSKKVYFRSSILIKSLYILMILTIGSLLLLAIDENFQTMWLMTTGAMSGVFLSYSYSVATMYQEQEKFFKHSLADFVFALLTFGAVSSAYFYGFIFEIKDVILIYSLLSVLVGLLFFIYLQLKFNFIGKVDGESIKDILKHGKWVIGVTIFLFLFPRIDVFILPSFVSFEDVGVYGAASQLIMTVALLIRSLSKVILPKAMGALHSSRSLKLYLKSSFITVLIIIVVIVVMMMFSKMIIISIYGKEFMDAVLPFRILLVGSLFTVLYLPFSFLYYAIDIPYFRFWIELSKFFMGAGIIASLVCMNGMVGAALGVSFTNVIFSLLSFFVIYKKIKIHIKFQHGRSV